MKRFSGKLTVLFLILQAIYPVSSLAGALAGWQVVPEGSITAYALFAALNIGLAAGILRGKARLTRRDRICLSLSLPAGLLNGLLLMLSGLKFAACMALVSAICCFGLYRFGKEIKALRIFTGVLAGILVALLLIVMPFSLIFGQFGKTTVLERVPSPDGRHVAFVVDSDEGALGGSTVVRVEKTSLPFRMAKPFFSVRKNVFIGDWGIGDELSVEWLGESVLLVDDKQYGF